MGSIVVIDDSSTVLQIVAEILAEAGYRVEVFASGKSALQALRAQPVELIITDIYMPDEDGLELIRDSRRICPQTPIIAMSGMSGKRNMLDVAGHFGACCTLLKPFSKAELMEAVKTAIGKSSPSSGLPAGAHDKGTHRTLHGRSQHGTH